MQGGVGGGGGTLNLTLHLKELKKEQQMNHKTSKRKEIINIKPEIN